MRAKSIIKAAAKQTRTSGRQNNKNSFKNHKRRRKPNPAITMWLDADAGDLNFFQIWWRQNYRLKRRPSDVQIVKRYVHRIVAHFRWQVSHVARSIAVIATIDGRFAWALDSHTEPTLAGTSCVDHKLGRITDHSTLQTRADRSNLSRIAAVQTAQSKGTWRYRSSAKANAQQILAELIGREINEKSFGSWNDVGANLAARRTGDGYG